MGSCVSVWKNPESDMKLQLLIGSQNEELLIPSPVKEKPDMVNVADLALKSQWFHNSSKEEIFFDSQPWLDSDCEDDFVSVNGDFTPSRGSTPVHHNFTMQNLRLNNVPVVEGINCTVPEPSPPDKKKRLSELFKESLHVNEENTAGDENIVFPSKNSEGISERNPNGMLRTEDKSAQCCFPGFLSSRSFSETKTKMNPAQIL